MKALVMAPLLVLSTLLFAYAAEPEIVTLACQGTVKHGIPGPGSDVFPGKQGDPEPASMTIILNFTTGEVEVPDLLTKFPIKIKIVQATDVLVVFNGHVKTQGYSSGFMGTINRLTGETEAHKTVEVTEVYSTTTYALKCTPT